MNRPFPKPQFLSSPRNQRLLVLFGLLVLVMQFSDPLSNTSLTETLVFWGVRVTSVFASLIVADWLVERVLAERWSSPPWLKPAIVTMLVAAIPMTLAEYGLESLYPQGAAYDDSGLREFSPLLAGLGEYLTIVSIILPLNLLLWFVIDYRSRDDVDPEIAEPSFSVKTNDVFGGETGEPSSQATTDGIPGLGTEEPAFLAKTNGIRLEDVISLGAEEHYVRVFTRDHSELVYARLGDAIAEMPETLGTQVHRSWWVADKAVVAARRGTRRYRLELVDGSTVPVSDRFAKAVRARGLLVRRARKTPPPNGDGGESHEQPPREG